jgi:hypothetical protein
MAHDTRKSEDSNDLAGTTQIHIQVGLSNVQINNYLLLIILCRGNTFLWIAMKIHIHADLY